MPTGSWVGAKSQHPNVPVDLGAYVHGSGRGVKRASRLGPPTGI